MTTAFPAAPAFKFLDIGHALEQIGDPVSLMEMLPMVQETLERDVPLIAELLGDGNVLTANELLHPLKGFIPIFCTAALCNHVTEVEVFSKTATSSEVIPLYAKLMPELQQLQYEVEQFIASNAKKA